MKARHAGRGSHALLALATVMLLAAPLGHGQPAHTQDAVTSGVRERDPSWVAPEQAASKPNPLAGRPGADAGGRKIFRQRCVACHADDGRGTSKGPDLTQPEVQSESDGTLFWKITSGNTREGMPTFSSLPEAQRWQIVLHLRALSGR
jgi:mono/diheme cytochrome c family protein